VTAPQSQNHTAFPDFVFEPTRVSPTTGAVLVEGRFTGTHLRSWRGLPATGRKVDFQMCLIFEFDGESMTSEKVYFDLNTPLRQLGIADDYNSLRGKLGAVLGHPPAGSSSARARSTRASASPPSC
jgi:hypothetical protein